jgi:mono/diheme cytochrome c family protein
VDTEAAGLYLPLIVIGIGTGLFFSPNNALLLANAPPERAGMVSGLFGTIRQAGYAFGFALIASLFAATQDFYETNWTRTGFGRLTPDAADQLTAIFDGGGIWSPEMLVFILRVSAIVCTAILLVALINSLPRLKMTGRGQVGALAASAGAAVLGVYALLIVAPGGVVVDESVAAPVEAPVPPPVAPFGMPARVAAVPVPVPVAGAAAGRFAEYCASCHGGDGRGLPGLGVNLVESAWVGRASPADVSAFLRKGRMPNDPGNTTGRPMPAFEWLGEEALAELARELKAWSR